MHDAKGKSLKEGDLVIFVGKITDLYASEDYCNVSVESLMGRRPDGIKEKVSAINTGTLLRANFGDGFDIGVCFADLVSQTIDFKTVE